MLGSAVQVRPLLPSTEKAAHRAAFFVAARLLPPDWPTPLSLLLGTAQEGLPVQVRPLLPSTEKAAQSGGHFCGGEVTTSSLADPAHQVALPPRVIAGVEPFCNGPGCASDPWRFRCKVSGAMVRPGGSCLATDGQTNSGHG